MITKTSEIRKSDINFDFKNRIIFVNREITARALYFYIQDIFNQPAQMDDVVPMTMRYVCEHCGHADWKLVDSWIVEGEAYIRNEIPRNKKWW